MIEAAFSPQEMRARLARSYLESYRRAGIKHTEQEIQALALADCELVDAARARGEISNGPKKPVTAMPVRDKNAPPPAPIAKALEQTGTRLESNATPDRFAFLHFNPQTVTEQWGYATARINRILEACARASTLGEAIEGSEYPKLAREYAELWAFFMTRGQPPTFGKVDHNPFRGLSDRDASRLFMRKVFDICDRSTGVLGHWWVK